MKPWMVEQLLGSWPVVGIRAEETSNQVYGCRRQLVVDFRWDLVSCTGDFTVQFFVSGSSVWEAATEHGEEEDT